MRKVIGIDVDEVVFENVADWVEWARLTSGLDYSTAYKLYDRLINKTHYECNDMFKDVGIDDPMDFWNDNEIYDNQEPILNCVKVIEWLQDKGFDVVFISACRKRHYESKAERLEELFPDIELISARSKWRVKLDYLIDDRPYNCERYANEWPGAEVIQFRGVLKNIKKITAHSNVTVCDNWLDVQTHIMKLEQLEQKHIEPVASVSPQWFVEGK